MRELRKRFGRKDGGQDESRNKGQQAIDRLMKERIDLVLLDVMLPDMDGHETCKIIREPQVGYRGPIIFMSCMGDSGNIIDAFRKGGNDYIVKTVKMEDLLERIRTHTEDKKDKNVTKRWFKQFMIDVNTRSVYRVRDHVLQERIDLSKTEYDILQAFAGMSDDEMLTMMKQLSAGHFDKKRQDITPDEIEAYKAMNIQGLQTYKKWISEYYSKFERTLNHRHPSIEYCEEHFEELRTATAGTDDYS